MKITKSQLKQIIKEELEATMDEGFLDKLMGRKEADNQTLLYPGSNAIKTTMNKSGDDQKVGIGLGRNPVGLGLAAIATGKVNLATPKGQRPEDKLKPSSATVDVRYRGRPSAEADFNPIKIATNKGVPPETEMFGPVNANKDVEYLLKQLENLNADGFMASYDGPGGFENVDAPELAKRIYLDFVEKIHKFSERPDEEIVKHLEVAKQQLGV